MESINIPPRALGTNQHIKASTSRNKLAQLEPDPQSSGIFFSVLSISIRKHIFGLSLHIQSNGPAKSKTTEQGERRTVGGFRSTRCKKKLHRVR